MTWRVGFSSGICLDLPILEVLPAIRASGATGLEVGTPPRHFDPRQNEQVAAVRDAIAALSLTAVSIHAPFGPGLDLADENRVSRDAAVEAIAAAALAIKTLGGLLVVVHPSDLERARHDVGARLAQAAVSLADLAERCRQEGLTLVLESPLPHLIGGAPDEFAWLLKRLDPSVRVCLDTGHTALGHHWHQFLNVADGRVVHIHANDNHGDRDDHLPPGDGRIDWPEIGRTLEAAGFAGWIMLELRCPDETPASYFTSAFERAAALLA